MSANRPQQKNAGVIRWSLAALAILVLIAIPIFYRQPLTITPSQLTLPADGREHAALRIRFPRFQPASNVTEMSTRTLRLVETTHPTVLDGVIQAPVSPGRTSLHLQWRSRTYLVGITFTLDPTDSYGDGTPDFLRLHTPQDRLAFRDWFTSLAEAQIRADKLPAEIDDCAALLRYCYREALHAHDAAWLQSQAIDTPPSSVRQYTYPLTPLGASLFRVRPGEFVTADLQNGAFAQFADAQTLMRLNTYLIGRDINRARPGDLIFFRQLEQESPYDDPVYHSPFHSMIVCPDQAVLYHTGPIHHGPGGMRRMLFVDLLHHPDARWRPLPQNSNFLGVYRWNILREGD